MDTTVSVPMVVVRKLESGPGGINPVIDDLRKNHRIHASYDRQKLDLQGHNENILDIAVDFLKTKVGLDTASNKTLGGNGTVTCTYTGKPFTHIQQLFKAERQELLKVESVKITEQPKIKKLVLSCSYQDYEKVNGVFDKKIHECKEKLVKVDTKDISLAEQFEKDKAAKSWYCCLNTDKKDKSKTEIQFYGIAEKDCKEGISAWEKIKKDDKNKPTWYVPGTEAKNGASQEDKTSDKHEVTKSDKKDNATLKSNHFPKANSPDNDNARTMDADWNETGTPATRSPGTTIFSKPQMNVNSTGIGNKSQSGSKPLNLSVTAGANGGHGNTAYPRVTVKDVKITPGRITGSGDAAKYSFQIEDTIFYVYKESITEIKGMDAITNAANEKLFHGGGVAYYISKAAGKRMDQDCRNYQEKNGPVPVTENYVSVPGDIKCNGIIHAVGPSWYDYIDRKDDCAKDLYKTIKNVFTKANSRTWKKVALSAISSGLFGVPKKLCAEMYVKAFADFATVSDGTVKEVHFIDINREILDLVIDAHKTWMLDPSKLEFKNALEYKMPVSKNQTKKEAAKKEQGSSIQFLGTDRTTYGETRYGYCVCNKLKVFVYTGSLTRLETVDGIVLAISPDRYQSGLLERSVRSLAGPKYSSEVDKYRNGKNGTVFVSNEAGKMGCNHIVHVISASVRSVDKASLSPLYDVYRLALTFSYKNKMRSLGMPLFGSGWASNETDIKTLCYNLIQTLVSVCCDSRSKMNIEEIHLVNLDRDISSCLQEEFGRVSKGIRDPEQKMNYKKSTFYTKINSKSMTEDRFWERHTPIEKGCSAKGKSVADRKDERKYKHEETLAMEKAPPNGKCEYCDKQAASMKIKGCNHMYCTACLVPMKNSNSCTKCSAQTKRSTMSSSQADESCPICWEPLRKAEELPCSHKLCQTCFQKMKTSKPQCPVCQHIFGDIRGNQPEGEMLYRHVAWKSLPGHDGCGTIEIHYIIPAGMQEEYHPNPKKPYKGIERQAYLPDNKEGKEILYLLRKAFDRKLVFTIGESRTTGKEDVVTWNDIHHKTNPTGGPQRFGYPDPTYLVRVREELAAKGVTE